MLHDFTFRDPEEILAELKAGGGMGISDGHRIRAAIRLNATSAYDAFLANDRTLDDPEIVRVEKGGRIRLRIINAAAASNMWIDLGALEGELIAVDGNSVMPLTGIAFPARHRPARRYRRHAAARGRRLADAVPAGRRDGADRHRPRDGERHDREDPGRGRDGACARSCAGTSAPRGKPLRPEPSRAPRSLMLTGGGADYVWGFNGKPSMHDTLFAVKLGSGSPSACTT